MTSRKILLNRLVRMQEAMARLLARAESVLNEEGTATEEPKKRRTIWKDVLEVMPVGESLHFRQVHARLGDKLPGVSAYQVNQVLSNQASGRMKRVIREAESLYKRVA